MIETNNGKWELLTAWLIACEQEKVELTDDQIQAIVHSRDARRPYPIADHPDYNITERAKAAGYSVKCDINKPESKIFIREINSQQVSTDAIVSIEREKIIEGSSGSITGLGIGGVIGGVIGSVLGPIGTGLGAMIGAGMGTGGSSGYTDIPTMPEDSILVERDTPLFADDRITENLLFLYVGGATKTVFNVGDKLPCYASLICTTIQDNQSEFTIELRRGVKDKYEDNRLLVTLTVSGLETAKAHVPQIKVSIFLDEDKKELYLHVINLNPGHEVTSKRLY